MTSEGQKFRIAIVDDEEEILQALKRVLRKHFEIEVFLSAQDCLACLQDQNFDIVLSDIRMPYMDGFQLMQRLQESHSDITRLCMSGYADMEECQNAIEDGLFEFMVAKPWDNFELKQLLNVFAQKTQLQRELRNIHQPE